MFSRVVEWHWHRYPWGWKKPEDGSYFQYTTCSICGMIRVRSVLSN